MAGRRERMVRGGWLLLALALAPVLCAGQFQEPTPEELKMTADLKAPGAAAVYLYREDVTNQIDKTRIFYERIKILSEKGKELATVRTPYLRGVSKVAAVEGRTIHSDGTVVPLTAKPEDLIVVKTKKTQIGTVVFTLPAVEVGSILEYRIRINYEDVVADPTWWIQQPQYVHKAHYGFRYANTGFHTPSYVEMLGSGAKVTEEKKHGYVLDIEDVPALPDEDWMPPLNAYKWRVMFFYSWIENRETFWKNAALKWGNGIQAFIEPSGVLKKAAAGIAGKAANETEKARLLYAEAMKLENTDFTRRKSEREREKEGIRTIDEVADVWKARQGTGNEITALFVALARAAGLHVDPMIVVDRGQAQFDGAYLDASQMSDYIAVAKLDGKDVFLDPGQKMCPFGLLKWQHTLTSGFRLSGKEAGLARTPPPAYTGSMLQRSADLKVDAGGAVTGVIRIAFSGQQALYWRQAALTADEEEVQKRLAEWVQGNLPEEVQVEFDHFVALDDANANLLAYMKVTGTLGSVTGKHLFLPAQFFEAKSKHPFVTQDHRTIPVDVHYPETEGESVIYHLPAGYALETAPTGAEESWEGHAAFKIAYDVKSEQVVVVRKLVYNYTILDAKDYGNLHDFYQKIAVADQQQLVLTKVAAAKGN